MLDDTEIAGKVEIRPIEEIAKKLGIEGKNLEKYGEYKAKFSPEKVYKKRRENYDFWLNRMYKRKDVRLIFEDLPEGVCPLYFPVIVEEAEKYIQEMLSKGIRAIHWPPLPKEIQGNPEYAAANFLAEHVVVLPVHQSVDQEYLASVIN